MLANAAFSWAVPPVLGALLGFVAARLASIWAVRQLLAARRIQESARAAIGRLLSSPSFLHEVRQLIARGVSSASSILFSELLVKINAKFILQDRILPAFRKPEIREFLSSAAGEATHTRAKPLISDEILDSVSGIVAQQLPLVIERLIEWMESAPMRDTMAERGRELLPQILEQLNVMQRFLLSAGQFDKRLDEKMPEIVEETLQALERVVRDPAQQQAMRERILLAIHDWRDGQKSRTDAAVLVTRFVDKYLEGLGESAAAQSIYTSLAAFLTRGRQTLGGFLRHHAGVDDSEISDSLANFVLRWVSRPETVNTLSEKAATISVRLIDPMLQTRLPGIAGLF